MVELGFHLCDNENLKGKLNYYHMYLFWLVKKEETKNDY